MRSWRNLHVYQLSYYYLKSYDPDAINLFYFLHMNKLIDIPITLILIFCILFVKL